MLCQGIQLSLGRDGDECVAVPSLDIAPTAFEILVSDSEIENVEAISCCLLYGEVEEHIARPTVRKVRIESAELDSQSACMNGASHHCGNDTANPQA